MRELTIGNGAQEFMVNGHALLRFNPSDLNLYERFSAFLPKIKALEKDMAAKLAKTDDARDILKVMSDFDKRIKAGLTTVFGEENDFNAIFDGVNVLAFADGERVITNFVNALAPIIEAGVSEYATESARSRARELAEKANATPEVK